MTVSKWKEGRRAVATRSVRKICPVKATSSRIGIYRARPRAATLLCANTWRGSCQRENSRDLFAYDSLDGLSVRAGSGLERITRIFIKRYEHWNEPDENQYLTPAWEFAARYQAHCFLVYIPSLVYIRFADLGPFELEPFSKRFRARLAISPREKPHSR